MKFALQFVRHFSVPSTKIRPKLRIHYKAVLNLSAFPKILASSTLARSARERNLRNMVIYTHPRNFGNHVTVRPSVHTTGYQGKKTQWTGMAIGKANATRRYFGGKSHSQPLLVKQNNLRLNKDDYYTLKSPSVFSLAKSLQLILGNSATYRLVNNL